MCSKTITMDVILSEHFFFITVLHITVIVFFFKYTLNFSDVEESDDEIGDDEEMFKKYDIDGDGFITQNCDVSRQTS